MALQRLERSPNFANIDQFGKRLVWAVIIEVDQVAVADVERTFTNIDKDSILTPRQIFNHLVWYFR